MKSKIMLLAALAVATSASAQREAQSDTVRSQSLDEVVVKGVRAGKKAPFAVTEMKKQELHEFSRTGRELPFLFSGTPGVLAWGENGLGTGTVAMRLRGADGTRINITLDGISLNSPEDECVWWANMNSYGALLQSAQIQRGIGTSSNGDGAFGGSIALQLLSPALKPSLEGTFSYGSYNTMNGGFTLQTGRIWKNLYGFGAWHGTHTDGYVHGTKGNSGSYLGGLSWLGEKYRISYKNVGNYEHTGQAWNGVITGNDDLSLYDGTYGVHTGIRSYKDLYKVGLGRYNNLYEQLVWNDDYSGFKTDANGKYLTERYKMRDGSYWSRTTDNFVQDHNILSGVWEPSEHWSHHLALHYTYGHGYYEEFRPQYKLAKFGLTFTDAEGNKLKKSDFVRHKGLTQHTYGMVYNANYKTSAWDVVGGLSLQQFRCNHYGFLSYIADEALDNAVRPGGKNYRYYDSDAHKYDYSGYLKATYSFLRYWNAFADLQYRHVEYNTDGNNDKFRKRSDGTYVNQPLNIDKYYNFFNPKAGLSFTLGAHKAYASIAYAGREPERNNFTNNAKYPAPSPEHLLDYELGYEYRSSLFHAGANLYYMNYHYQFVQTGEKSDIGKNLTTNIRRSYRCGVELTAGAAPLSWLSLEGNAAFSVNRIKDFTEYLDDWDNAAPDDYSPITHSSASDPSYKPTTVHYDKSTLAFSPTTILNGFADFHIAGFTAVWHTNFVSRQYLDNTESKDRSLPCFSQSDITLGYTLRFKDAAALYKPKSLSFSLSLNNIFDRHYAASGWVYSAVSASRGHTESNRYEEIGYVPMAGFTMMGNITINF